MPIDLERVRADTPGCADIVHFNNAGASLPPRAVTEAMIAHLRREAAIGGYEAADEAADAIEGTYRSLARMLNCDPAEIAVLDSATRAWDMAFYAFEFRAGDRILTGVSEYASNYLAFLQISRKTGAVIEIIPDDAFGQLDLGALDEALRADRGRVRLIAVTHVPTNGGLINPAAGIGKLAREHGVPFLLDACQSAGQMPLDVKALGCTMLTATGRKYLRGPRGVGFLYIDRAWAKRLEPPFIDLHAATWTVPESFELRDDARRFESWERNVAAHLGLGVAVDYALALGLDSIQARIGRLASRTRARLEAHPELVVLDKGLARCGIVTFIHLGEEPAETQRRLAAAGVNVSVSSRASTRLDMEARDIHDLVRASVHYYNTDAEIDRLAEVAAVRPR
jgi:cysteine desulfurase / selenocysteine lyase